MRILTVVGTRPQLIKAAAVQPALRAIHEEIFVDTGQHYDDDMAGRFFRELSLASPDFTLGISGGTSSTQTGRMLIALEPVVEKQQPDAILVYGDTNSTLAGALVGAKLRIPVAHIEAGLRSFDRRMPEEINRIVADHLSTWLFAPTQTAVANLQREGITSGVRLSGDVLRESCLKTAAAVADTRVLLDVRNELGLPVDLIGGAFVFATMHRAENREPAALQRWLEVLAAVVHMGLPVVLALHPGTREKMHAQGFRLPPGIHLTPPTTYRSAIALQMHARAVVTDSGGIQRESGWLGTPCVVLRGSTEWVEMAADPSVPMELSDLEPGKVMAIIERLRPSTPRPAIELTDAPSQTIVTALSETLTPQPSAPTIGSPQTIAGSR